MIKETLIQLSHELNRLDQDSDTILMIDWSSRSVLLAQRLNEQFISNNFWILIDSTRDSGKTVDVITSNKLKALKSTLLRVINNFSIMELVPEEYGFSTKRYFEAVYKGKMMNSWTTEGKFRFRNNLFMKIGLYLLSKPYRVLRKTLLKSKFE